MSASYFCVQTKSNCEFCAERFLTAVLRFKVYLPRVKVRRAHAGRIDAVVRPFLARYLFIEDDGRGPFFFRSAPGVAAVVKYGNVPVLLRRNVIDAIKAREDSGFVQLGDDRSASALFARGERVQYRDDKLTAFEAVFHEYKSSRRAFIMVEMMGRAAKVEVALKDLERVTT